MNWFSLFGMATLFPALLHAQLSIERCQELARANYPIIQRYALIEQTAAYNVSNAGKGYLPQILLYAKASYQSDVTSLPFQIPGIEISGLPKDQYAATFDISQALWDGGFARAQKGSALATKTLEQEQLNVELYALEKRVNQLFFGTLLIESQLELNRLLQEDLQRHYRMIEAFVINGIANPTDLDAVSVEQLRAQQFFQQLLSSKNAYIQMLSFMIGQRIEETTSFVKPNHSHLPPSKTLIHSSLPLSPLNTIVSQNIVNRPELSMFEAQKQLFSSQKQTISSTLMPRFHLFVQGGYGKPGLNMLNGNFSPFYIGGIRLTWNFGALYTRKNDLQKLNLAQLTTQTLLETFLYHTQIEITQQSALIQQLQKTMEYDTAIISLRENIRLSAEAKVANGTLSFTELMRELNAETIAKQERITHEIELLTAIYDLKFTTGQ